VLLVLATISLASAGVASLIGHRIASRAIEQQSFDKLVAVREMKANQVEDYIQQIVDQTLTLAESPMVIDAMRALRNGFVSFAENVGPSAAEAEEREVQLRIYYQDQFLRRLEEVDAEVNFDVTDFWPALPGPRMLQESYISENPFELGSKHLLDAAADGSAFSRAHRRYHPVLRNFLERFGYYDLFLVDHETGDIVYSVFKEVDFGTSLLSGPYRDSNLARAFLAAREAATPGFTKLVDFEPYLPSYGAQASFIATPIHDEGEIEGILVFQMPIDRINSIMTSRQEWARVGLGVSGETYIVGEDLTLRNQSRFLIEDRDDYFRAIEDSGVGPPTVRRIARLGSAIGLQEVRTAGTRAAVAGETGIGTFPDYRGVVVFSAYRPLEVPDVHWVIMSEIDRAEALAPVRTLRNRAVMVFALLLLVILGIAYWFSNTLTRPIQSLAQVAGELAQGRLHVEVETGIDDEIGDLSRSFEAMRKSLVELVERQDAKIEALSVPLIPVRDDMMAMPLIGELDPRRMEKVREILVEGLHTTSAKAVLLDLTGVSRLSEPGAAAMIRAAKAARLLGVQVVLTGMQPGVASDLAQLDLHLEGIETARSLESGIEMALNLIRRSVERSQFEEESV
jgi:anti-anti-sigma factor